MNNIVAHFTILSISFGFFIATLFSAPIYLHHFEIDNAFIHSIIPIISLYFILTSNKKYSFFIGGFIGLLWFYWITLSFRYYDTEFLIPLALLAIFLIYGILFLIILYFENVWIRALLLISLSYIAPLGFNWLVPEVLFTFSYFGVNKLSFALILLSLVSFISLDNKLKFIAIIPLLFAFQKPQNVAVPDLKIEIVKSQILQNEKWDKEYIPSHTQENFAKIGKAIEDKKELIIFPETAFAMFLHRDEVLMEKLLKLSKKITIFTGALKYENNNFYNSSYLFQNGKVDIFDKVVLVPFGEEIPMPSLIRDLINDIFFNGAQDYSTALTPSDFKIKEYTFRNAICYEATTTKIIKDSPKYIIAISNNAWFTPSIEPALQNMLLHYYSKKYNKVIFHSANMGISEVIKP